MLTTATQADAQDLTILINRAYRVEDEIFYGDRTTAAEIARMIAQPDSWFLLLRDTAVDPPRIVGTARVRLLADSLWVGPVAVEPERQRQGLGKKLLSMVEEFCRAHGRNRIDLDVVNLRTPLLSFYESLGFTVTGTEAYSNPERLRVDAHLVLMSKQL